MPEVETDAGSPAAPTFATPSRNPRGAGRNPLSTWLTVEPGQVTDELLVAIQDALAGSSLLHDPRWTGVLRGDEATTVAVGIDILHERNPTPETMDLAMSAVLLQAADGSAAAAVVLSHGLAISSHVSPEREEMIRRSELWARRWPRALPAPLRDGSA